MVECSAIFKGLVAVHLRMHLHVTVCSSYARSDLHGTSALTPAFILT